MIPKFKKIFESKETLRNRYFSGSTFRLLFILLAVMVAGTCILPKTFPTIGTLQAICKQVVEYGLLALGVAICMTSGGIDLSVVYTANLVAIVSGLFLKCYLEPSPSTAQITIIMVTTVIISLIIGLLCGLFNGFLIGVLKLPPMLVTLGTGQLYMGLSLILTKGTTVNGVPAISRFAFIQIFKLPISFYLFLLVAFFLNFIMEHTKYGVRTYLVGTSETVAKFSGIDIEKTLFMVYGNAGVLASISGLISLSYMSSAKADYGTSYILMTILISVLGGTDPNGGKISVLGVTLASIILQVISTLFNSLGAGINTFYRNMVWGGLLIIVLVMNELPQHLQSLRKRSVTRLSG